MTEEERIEEEGQSLETVPQNLFGINPIIRKRPYLADMESRNAYMQFMGYERGVLTARIAELNSRAEQILYIYLCRINKAYLAATAENVIGTRREDTLFYEWLDELAVQGVAYATRRSMDQHHGQLPTYRWDGIQKIIEICLDKGLDLETAAKVASVGVSAVEKYLKSGIISLDEQQEARAIGKDTMLPKVPGEVDGRISPEEVDRERQADILKELAEATSSRGATMLATDRIGTDFVKISAINREANSDIPGFVRYSIEAQIVKRITGEYTPYQTRFYAEEDAPIQVIKFILTKLSESLARTL
jgi:hypothetical protein